MTTTKNFCQKVFWSIASVFACYCLLSQWYMWWLIQITNEDHCPKRNWLWFPHIKISHFAHACTATEVQLLQACIQFNFELKLWVKVFYKGKWIQAHLPLERYFLAFFQAYNLFICVDIPKTNFIFVAGIIDKWIFIIQSKTCTRHFISIFSVQLLLWKNLSHRMNYA